MKAILFLIILLVFISLGNIHFSYSQSEITVSNQTEEIPKIIQGFGSEHTEDGKGFDIEYFLSANLDPDILINENENSLTFKIIGQMEFDNEWLIIMLPPEVIEFPLLVYVDGEKEPNSIVSTVDGISTMYIPLSVESKEVKIIGTKVIPEFGQISLFVLVISFSSIILLLSKNQKIKLIKN